MIPLDWQHRGSCAAPDIDPNIFFPEGPRSSSRPAKRICAGCPVRGRCLEHALEFNESGVWGGTNDYDRRRIRRDRLRASVA